MVGPLYTGASTLASKASGSETAHPANGVPHVLERVYQNPLSDHTHGTETRISCASLQPPFAGVLPALHRPAMLAEPSTKPESECSGPSQHSSARMCKEGSMEQQTTENKPTMLVASAGPPRVHRRSQNPKKLASSVRLFED